MMRKSDILLAALLISCMHLLVPRLNAQNVSEGERLLSYVREVMHFGKYNPQEKVYLHLDNTGYFKNETIWFKAYIIRTDDGRATDLSRVLYVELVNPSGNVVATKKYPIERGETHGDFRLDSIFATGFYEIRAYTRYMTNWGTNACFSRVIPIFKAPPTEGDYSKPQIDLYSYRKRLPNIRQEERDEEGNTIGASGKRHSHSMVRFYPESGNLVDGLTSRMGYSINDGDSLERGIVEITPHGEERTFRFTDKNRRPRSGVLPPIQPSGMILTMNLMEDSLVTAKVTATPDLMGRLYGCAVMRNGIIVAIDTFRLDGHWQRVYRRHSLSDGVHQITVFDSNGLRMAERLFFVYPKHRDCIQTTLKTEDIRPCGKVEVELRTLPNASISFSAIDAASITGGKAGNAHTWLLLSSDLKGYIDHPEYYFEADDQTHRQAADLLTMIQGWRRYDWNVMTGIAPAQSFQPIENQLYLYGQLHSRNKKRTTENVNITAYMYNKKGENMKASFTTGPDGKYHFTLPEIYGEWNLQLLTKKDERAQNYFIGIDRQFSPSCRWLSPRETRLIPLDSTLIYRPLRTMEEEPSAFISPKVHTLKNVTVKAKRLIGNVKATWYDESAARKKAVLYYDADADADSFADRGEEMPSIAEWLKMKNNLFGGENQPVDGVLRVPYESGLIAVNDFNAEHFTKRGRILWHDGLTYRGRAIVWIVDNQFCTITHFTKKSLDVFDESSLTSLVYFPTFIDEIKSVYITDDSNFLSNYIVSSDIMALSPAVVCIFRHPTFAWKKKGLRRTHFQGYSIAETFQMEDYSVLPPTEDLRRTLYWNPTVKTDSQGHATVEFYNNSSCTEMYISAEGLTQDGHFIVNEKR